MAERSPAAVPEPAPQPEPLWEATPPPSPQRKFRVKRRTWLWAAGAVVLIGAGVGTYLWAFGTDPASADLGPTDVVTRGSLVVTLTESGEIEAAKRRVIANELGWPVVIKDLVEEGARVKAGDTIIQFECKELIDAIAQQKIAVTTAKNNYTQAHENLELKRKELANNIQKAQQAVIDAKDDHKRYLEGEWPVKRDDAESAIKLAERDLALASDKLDFKRKANADPELNQPYSQNEIKADELSVQRLDLALKKAISNRDMLLKYDHDRQKRKLETAASDAELDLDRMSLTQKTQLLVSEAEEEAKKATLKLQEDKLTEHLEDEKKLIVKADKEGLVVYDTGSRRWGGADVTVAVGEKISSRQQLMIIPDLTTLQVKTKVYEAVIDQVRDDLPATIRLDARPDVLMTGRVYRVGVLPSSQHRWMSPNVKVFDVIVKFDPGVSTEGLKPNMTAQVGLVLARLKDTLSVPVAAVFAEQDKTYCRRVVGDTTEKAPVTVGLMNEARIQVLSGLKEGDRVLLAPSPEEAPAEGDKADRAEDENVPEIKPKAKKQPGKDPIPKPTTPGESTKGRGERPPRSRGDKKGPPP